ncbi:MAG: Bro-N domain-containing protein [Paracoccus sp. (in: a-proteobacteria)]|nr:Bro-N domain-containing protein [Paracoccus sp. (in: a-proteobacteria)]
MSSIILLDFETSAVHVVMQDGEPWLVTADVCRCLEIANSREAVPQLDADEKGVGIVNTLGGEQTLNIVSESGLYVLAFLSRKSAARRFRKWVTSEFYLRSGGTAAMTLPIPALRPSARPMPPCRSRTANAP